MAERMQHCFWCGDELGVYEHVRGDVEACGQRECQAAMRATLREMDDEAQERAREDGYERYR